MIVYEDGRQLALSQMVVAWPPDPRNLPFPLPLPPVVCWRDFHSVANQAGHVVEAHPDEPPSRELLGRGLVSQAEFDEVEAREAVAAARVQSATAEVENARSRLHAARIEYDKTFIRAPFAGAVLRKEAEVGEMVDRDAGILQLRSTSARSPDLDVLTSASQAES